MKSPIQALLILVSTAVALPACDDSQQLPSSLAAFEAALASFPDWCPDEGLAGPMAVHFECARFRVVSCPDLANVVLELDDGERHQLELDDGEHHQRDRLRGHYGAFGLDGRTIVGTWVRAGSNGSEGRPGYDQRFISDVGLAHCNGNGGTGSTSGAGGMGGMVGTGGMGGMVGTGGMGGMVGTGGMGGMVGTGGMGGMVGTGGMGGTGGMVGMGGMGGTGGMVGTGGMGGTGGMVGTGGTGGTGGMVGTGGSGGSTGPCVTSAVCHTCPEDFLCDSDLDCFTGWTCVASDCQTHGGAPIKACQSSPGSACVDSSDCPSDYQCLSVPLAGSRCVKTVPGCTSDYDCVLGFSCENGACADRRVACDTHADCPKGHFCKTTTTTRFCGRVSRPCYQDGDCGGITLHCADVDGNGTKECAGSTNPGDLNPVPCMNSMCSSTNRVCEVVTSNQAMCGQYGLCQSAADCASGFNCVGLWPDGHNECVPSGGSCDHVTDCPLQQVCASPRTGGPPSCQTGSLP